MIMSNGNSIEWWCTKITTIHLVSLKYKPNLCVHISPNKCANTQTLNFYVVCAAGTYLGEYA